MNKVLVLVTGVFLIGTVIAATLLGIQIHEEQEGKCVVLSCKVNGQCGADVQLELQNPR